MNGIPLRCQTRRKLIGAIGGMTTAAALSSVVTGGHAVAAMVKDTGKDTGGTAADPAARRLRLVSVHTGEKLSVVYWEQGDYLQESLNKINFLLRDFRAREVLYIDTGVIDYLHSVYSRLQTSEPIQILSGYRSPATNEMLRKRSSGVAKNSLHIVGKAIDFRVPGRKTRLLKKTAMQMQRGGIGLYHKSDFVHIDSGPFRHWE